MRNRWWLPFLAALAAWPAAARAVTADYARTPVLMVHGYFIEKNAGTTTWATFKKNLIQDGWPEEYIETPSFNEVRGCDPEHALEVQAWVDALTLRTGFDQVDIVCHSEGCLNTLHYLKDLCGMPKVRRMVLLAGAVHGTVVACVDLWSCGAKEMCIGSGPDGWKENEGLVALHQCDETPGDVLYTSVWSEYDEIIVPPRNSELAGAQNIEMETKWVEHGGIFLSDESYGYVRDTFLGLMGANEDGPSWACWPQCQPPAPEETDAGDEAEGEGSEGLATEEAPDAASEAGTVETLPQDVPAETGTGDATDAALADRGGAEDASQALPEAVPDASTALPEASGAPGSGCRAGPASDVSAGLWALLLACGIAWRVRRCL